MAKYLDEAGLSTLWTKIKETFVAQNCFLLKIYLIIFDVFEINLMPGTWCVPAKTRARS